MALSTRNPGDGLFAQQLHRAAAQRGRLDPVYQDLSGHWTRLLQKLYPVWVLMGPGLADPGHIELHSRQVFLDSDALLGSREEILAGTLDPQRILTTFGVGIHEVMHAKHTKRWVLEYDLACEDAVLVADRRLLEEPRMEATGVRQFPERSTQGRFVRRALEATAVNVILPRLAKEIALSAMAGGKVTRDMAGHSMTYLQARTHYGALDPAVLAGTLEPIWRAVLGDADMKALNDLYARVIWIPDGEIDRMDKAAREYREIIGPPDPPPSSSRPQAGGASAAGGAATGGEDDSAEPTAQSLAAAIEEACDQATTAQLEQLNEDVDLKELLAKAADDADPTSGGSGTGAPTGRMPKRGVNRPPMADEVQHARRYANRLRQALTLGTKRIDKRTPGGRFNSRAYMRAQAQRKLGQRVTAKPWCVTRQVKAPIEAPHVGLIIDTSGSMGGYEYALGPISWIVQEGLRAVDGRCAISLFGNGCELLSDGSKPMSLVPGIKTGGGTAFAGDAIELVCEHLEMDSPRRPRFVYILSDGGWYDTQAGVQKIRWLADQGVPTIHLSIGIEPLSVEADRICVLDDPADALDHMARDTVEALRAASRTRVRA